MTTFFLTASAFFALGWILRGARDYARNVSENVERLRREALRRAELPEPCDVPETVSPPVERFRAWQREAPALTLPAVPAGWTWPIKKQTD